MADSKRQHPKSSSSFCSKASLFCAKCFLSKTSRKNETVDQVQIPEESKEEANEKPSVCISESPEKVLLEYQSIKSNNKIARPISCNQRKLTIGYTDGLAMAKCPEEFSLGSHQSKEVDEVVKQPYEIQFWKVTLPKEEEQSDENVKIDSYAKYDLWSRDGESTRTSTRRKSTFFRFQTETPSRTPEKSPKATVFVTPEKSPKQTTYVKPHLDNTSPIITLLELPDIKTVQPKSIKNKSKKIEETSIVSLLSTDNDSNLPPVN